MTHCSDRGPRLRSYFVTDFWHFFEKLVVRDCITIVRPLDTNICDSIELFKTLKTMNDTRQRKKEEVKNLARYFWNESRALELQISVLYTISTKDTTKELQEQVLEWSKYKSLLSQNENEKFFHPTSAKTREDWLQTLASHQVELRNISFSGNTGRWKNYSFEGCLQIFSEKSQTLLSACALLF